MTKTVHRYKNYTLTIIKIGGRIIYEITQY